MTSDFIISQPHGQWQIVAISERGKSFATGDVRFHGDKIDLDAAEALAIYRELHDKGFYPAVPNGLPPLGHGLIFSRLALLLALIVTPIMIFVLLA